MQICGHAKTRCQLRKASRLSIRFYLTMIRMQLAATKSKQPCGCVSALCHACCRILRATRRCSALVWTKISELHDLEGTTDMLRYLLFQSAHLFLRALDAARKKALE